MSWVVEEWKEGLPTKTLQKIQELESQVDKLKKERQQKQFQLESLEAAFQKQKQKVESEKGEVTALKRENQSLIELCDNQEKAKQKLSHDYQVKETQVNFLEGQVAASKKHIEKLEHDLKRHKNDLEKSQQSFNAGDMSLCATPQKPSGISYTPNKYSDSKYEDLQDRYNKELEERKKLERELKMLQMKTANQTPQPSSHSTMNHRDIARHQSSSSVFSWQQERTPSRSSSSSHDTSLKRSFASSHFPWDQEETPSKKGFKMEDTVRSASDSYSTQVNEQLRSQNQELKSKITELEIRIQVQEKELKTQINRYQETPNLLEKTQTDLAEKDRTFTKTRDDLARVKMQLEQSADKCVLAEQKLKKVTEELGCQRQNAESTRVTMEQKSKEREKENQQELLRQQNSLKNLEQQLNQMKTKQSQESQQAKNQFNAIQAELDKVSHSKRILESEIEELKQKLCRSEEALHKCQKNENDFKKKMEEVNVVQNNIKCQYDQKCKDALKLEEELKTANQTLRQNQLFVEEMKNKTTTLEGELKSTHEKLKDQDSFSVQHLKITLSNLEKERDLAQELLNKRAHDIEDSKISYANMVEESRTLKNQLDCKDKECKDLINTNISLCNWKIENEKMTNQLSREKVDMARKISDLEGVNHHHLGQMHSLESDKNTLDAQIKMLQDIVDAKMADLDIQKAAYNELQYKLEMETLKCRGEMEKLVLQNSELKAQIEEQKLTAPLEQMPCFEKAMQQEKELSGELQKERDELLRNQVDIKNRLVECEGTHERFVADSRGQVQTLQSEISSQQSYISSLLSTISEKEGEITCLAEKLRFQNTEVQSSVQSNTELTLKLQDLQLLSESWSTERDTLTTLISSNQKSVECLTNENERINELNGETTHLLNRMDMEDCVEEKRQERLDRNEAEDQKELTNLKLELAELKEKLCEAHRQIEQQVKLIGDLQSKEKSRNKVIEEFRVTLEEKERLSSKLQINLEKEGGTEGQQDGALSGMDEARLTISLVDHVVGVNEDSSIIHVLKSPVLNNTDLKQNNSKTEPREDMSCYYLEEDKTLLFERVSVNENNTVDQQCMKATGEGENDIPIKNPQISLNDAVADACVLSEQAPSIQADSTSVMLHSNDQEECTRSRPRKSLSGELIDDSIFSKSFEEELQAFASVEKKDTDDLIQLFALYQTELHDLKKQHASDIAILQEKLKEQASEMERRLAEERKQTENLSLELDAARLELQCLDLSARSLLSFDVDDLTKPLEPMNQSVCSALPIGSLSLNITDMQTNENPKDLLQSPGASSLVKSPGRGSLRNIIIANLKCTPKSSKDTAKNIFETPQDTLKVQTVIENLKLQAQQFSSENMVLLQRVEDGDQKIETFVAEIKNLKSRIEMQTLDLVGKDEAGAALQNNVKELEDERALLLEKLEILTYEKQQLTVRVGDLEKNLRNLSNMLEMLKIQFAELSAVREGLEISNGDWKEKYLQTENELRRTKSEKANLENHALSLEADLDILQTRYKSIQDENTGNLKSVISLQDNLDVVLAEKNKVYEELESVGEEKEELVKMYQMLKEKENEYESNKVNTRGLLKILEDEIRALKMDLQSAKSVAEQLAAERDGLIGLQEAEKEKNTEIEELQKQVQLIQEEKTLLLKESEDKQTQVNVALSEKDKLSRALECCQFEKHEMGTSLNSAEEQVALMRAGIEKLKIRIESDEKKKRHVFQKLKESEHQVDSLKDKIETLERELTMSEENFEGAILQTETIREEAEQLKLQKEDLGKEMNSFRRKVVDLEQGLLERQNTIVELEARLASADSALEQSEAQQKSLKDESEKTVLLLQKQLNELLEQKIMFEERYQVDSAKHIELLSLMEQRKADLLLQLEESQVKVRNLEMSVDDLTSDLEKCQQKLEEKTQQLLALEDQLKHAEARESKHLTEVSGLKVDLGYFKNENEALQVVIDKLETKLQTTSAAYDTSEITLADLKTLCTDLELRLEASVSENQKLLQQVDDASANCTDLQCKLQDADQRLKTLEETDSQDRKALDQEIQTLRQNTEESNTLLHSVTTHRAEMEETITKLQNELDALTKKSKEDISEYESQLTQAKSKQQTLLNDLTTQHTEEIQSYQERLELVEAHLNTHKHENDRLKSSNEELNQSLHQVRKQLLEMNQLKTDVAQLREENAVLCNQRDLWIQSCKQLEQEREQLQKQITQQGETTTSLQDKPKDGEVDTAASDLLAEIEELKEWLEEKTLEADESVEKYCTLIIEAHKLEDANETLTKQVDLLKLRLEQLEPSKEACSSSHKPDSPLKACKGRGRKDRRSTHSSGKQPTKRQRAQENIEDPQEQTFTTPTSQRVTKRVKKTCSSLISTPQTPEEDAHFEPDGLPEVVKKGFADIPSGKRSPFILSRAALPRRSPRLTKQSPSNLSTPTNNLENLLNFPESTEGGSKSQMSNKVELRQLEAAVGSLELSSPLSAYNKLKVPASQSPNIGQRETRRTSTSSKMLHDQSESEETCNVQ
ncbi:centromere protein F [Pelodytes ibericus]